MVGKKPTPKKAARSDGDGADDGLGMAEAASASAAGAIGASHSGLGTAVDASGNLERRSMRIKRMKGDEGALAVSVVPQSPGMVMGPDPRMMGMFFDPRRGMVQPAMSEASAHEAIARGFVLTPAHGGMGGVQSRPQLQQPPHMFQHPSVHAPQEVLFLQPPPSHGVSEPYLPRYMPVGGADGRGDTGASSAPHASSLRSPVPPIATSFAPAAPSDTSGITSVSGTPSPVTPAPQVPSHPVYLMNPYGMPHALMSHHNVMPSAFPMGPPSYAQQQGPPSYPHHSFPAFQLSGAGNPSRHGGPQ